MRLTFHGHACVRLDNDDTILTLDPGAYSQAASALTGATAVLVTHDHQDHVDVAAVVAAMRADPVLPVYASGPAAQTLVDGGAPADRVHAVRPGQELTVGAARVVVGGGDHALIHPRIPQAVNVTYRVEFGGRSVYHPGDSFDLPAGPVDVLLTPVSGPWMKLGEAIDYAAAAEAPVLVPIHDALLTEIGHGMTQRQLSAPALVGERSYRRLRPGESLDV
ncbi:Zn-dependent hydrolase of the beta-lactamase fold-like protein [Xylanimonas cellulosilytica DSM 15894]|uniref:Zn-dependent hydrolase of the beta-lactamase fold-like protein n=1 Tax=Xylanimonas cellulosilytica (strain DSM 15894 / JCM 12276 / CECT 5975 / KCTC 9989 / LMG 20990 / NBRC 107835 / XIL07) TaxID=446471 RepID=D1BSS3_XYLCX|nr:MBL fold metallo-hydrolase [Xylanimonas cellulosilytica]ACZ30765.1 Zn-dependent hydrolase of the beta-lactamase fold-like protein [Xylanimonas cellulosilytica DSM 15894]